MNHILFMNDAPVAVVIGNAKYRQGVLERNQAKYYKENKGCGNWAGVNEYKNVVYWHYHEVETIEDRKEKNNDKNIQSSKTT